MRAPAQPSADAVANIKAANSHEVPPKQRNGREKEKLRRVTSNDAASAAGLRIEALQFCEANCG
jgi:hypothetical protein